LKTDDFSTIKEDVSPWGFVNKTPSSHIIAIPEGLTTNFGDDVFIGVFTTEGIFAGACSIQKGRSQVLVINANDPTTPETDGFTAGEPLKFRIWNIQTAEESELKVAFNPNQADHSGLFATDGISAMTNLEILNNSTENSFVNLQIFPNPTQGVLNISGIKDGSVVRITVFNQTGQQVLAQTIENDFQIDLHDFPAGLYFLKLDDGFSVKYEKVVLE
jgi:hypothetical protein